jgi:4-hydroxy-4-methyl-2-oxoglutarate aldolase
MAAVDRDEFSWVRSMLYSAVIADVLDGMGLRDQVLDVELRRYSGQHVLAGRARTMQWEDVESIDPRPYELELQAVDTCGAGEVLVAAAGGSSRSGVWGELLSTAAQYRGCAGVLVNGAVRDVAKINDLGFTVFARGTSARDSLHRQRVTALDVDVVIGSVRIAPGDMIFADADGAVVVPRAIERDALAKARDKVMAEDRTRQELRAGVSATEVFRKYGVL